MMVMLSQSLSHYQDRDSEIVAREGPFSMIPHEPQSPPPRQDEAMLLELESATYSTTQSSAQFARTKYLETRETKMSENDLNAHNLHYYDNLQSHHSSKQIVHQNNDLLTTNELQRKKRTHSAVPQLQLSNTIVNDPISPLTDMLPSEEGSFPSFLEVQMQSHEGVSASMLKSGNLGGGCCNVSPKGACEIYTFATITTKFIPINFCTK